MLREALKEAFVGSVARVKARIRSGLSFVCHIRSMAVTGCISEAGFRRCGANVAHIRQSRPDSGLDLIHFQYESL